MIRRSASLPPALSGSNVAPIALLAALWLCAAMTFLSAADDLPQPLTDTSDPARGATFRLRQPAGGEQEGPYYSARAGRAGLLFDVSRTLEGESLALQTGELRFEYARDWHRGDGGLGNWLGARGAWRYREIAVLGAFDERWFGAASPSRAQAAHLLFGGVKSQGHAKPYSEGGFGLCLWWPPETDRVRVLPEIGFRGVVWRLPAYAASVSAYRQGLAQDNGVISAQLELYGSGAWNFRHKEGWIYDGGVRVTLTVLQLQLSLSYHLYGLRRSFAQGPAGSVALEF